MPTPTAAERELARQISRLSRQVRQLQRGSQAGLRSPVISDGPVSYYDEGGVERFTVGPNDDGSVTASPINSEPPPTPTAPDLVPVEGGVLVSWDGTFVEVNAPADLNYVEIHLSDTTGFTAEDITQVSTFISANGGEFFVPAPTTTELFCALVAVNLEGIESEKSEEDSATPLPFPEPEVTVPPTDSPEIIAVHGTPNSLVVVTGPIAPTDQLQYYISTDADFVPDPATEVGPLTRATVNVLLTDANGSPLVVDTEYYIAVLASNAAGDAPAPSASIQGMLDLTAVAETIAAVVYAGFVLAGTIQVGNITIDANNGITIPTSAGDITFPVDGTEAYIQAAVTTTSLTARGITNLQEAIALAGTMVVAAGVDNPTIAPILMYYRPTQAPTGSLAGSWTGNAAVNKLIGLGADGTSFFSGVMLTGVPSILIQHRTTHAITYGIAASGPAGYDITSHHGYAYVNGYHCFVVIAQNQSTLVYTKRLLTYTLAGTVLTLVVNREIFAGSGTVTRMTVGVDVATKVMVVRPNTAAGGTTWTYESYDPSDGTVWQAATTMAIPVGDRPVYGNAALSGVHRGLADYGTARIIVSTYANDTVTFKDVAGVDTWEDPERWDRPATTVPGFFWDTTEGRFWHLSGGDGLLYPNSKVLTDFTVEGKYAWRDANATGGTHETGPSPSVISILWVKRLWLKFSASPAPGVGGVGNDKADIVTFYMKKNGAFQYRLIHTGAVGVSEIVTENFTPPFNNTGTQPKAVNEFIGVVGLEGLIASATELSGDPVWLLVGDGSGNVGPFAWDSAGAAIADATTVSGTAPFAGTLTLRRIGGMVFMMGSLSRASGFSTSFTAAGTIPAGWRPPVGITTGVQLFFNTTVQWQMTISAAGAIEIRMSAANSTAMGVGAMAWPAT